MRTRGTILSLTLVIAGCGLPGLDRTIWLPSHPDVQIRCDGGQPVPTTVCAAWAEGELADLPDVGTSKVSALVFTFRGGVHGDVCSVAFFVDGSRMMEKGIRPCPGDPTDIPR